MKEKSWDIRIKESVDYLKQTKNLQSSQFLLVTLTRIPLGQAVHSPKYLPQYLPGQSRSGSCIFRDSYLSFKRNSAFHDFLKPKHAFLSFLTDFRKIPKIAVYQIEH